LTKPEELIGVYECTRWRAPDGDYTIGFLEDETVVCGPAPAGELLYDLSYRFYGRWVEHVKYGRQFQFTHFTKTEPHSRHGVIAYLTKYAPNIGPATAASLWDVYGTDAVKALRTKPEQVAEAVMGLSHPRAVAAAAALQRMVELEDTKIALTDLLAGRGFPGVLIDQVIERWKVAAPARIKRDPFTLLVNDFAGCGFLRCDRLYCDLGLDPAKLKRQVICLWYVMHSDMSGSTWFSATECVRRLCEYVSGVKVQGNKAVACGVRAGWLAQRDGWLAEGKKAASEGRLANRIKGLDDGR
jgi:exodeoxyribonuclease V alpha subunit